MTKDDRVSFEEGAGLTAAAPYLLAALKKHQEFWKLISASLFDDCSSFDGSDVQDWAERCGLLRREPYSPEDHGDLGCDLELGEDIFVNTHVARDAIARAEQSS